MDERTGAADCRLLGAGALVRAIPGRQYQLTRRLGRYVSVIVIEEVFTPGWHLPTVALEPSTEPGVTVARVEIGQCWVALRRRNVGPVTTMIGHAVRRAICVGQGIDSYLLWIVGINDRLATSVRSGPVVADVIDPPFQPDSLNVFRYRIRRMVGTADLFLATAATLADEIDAAGGVCRRLPNGCDRVVEEAPPVPETPTAGFLGTLDWRFDWDLVEWVAARTPDVHWVLAGRVLDEMAGRAQHLGSLPNIELAGPQDLDSGVAFDVFARFTFGIIPFRTGFIGDAINPVKMYEYLAHGLGVIATPIRECRGRRATRPLSRGSRRLDRSCH